MDTLDYQVLLLRRERKTYVDVVLVFGFKRGASFCQFCPDAVTYLMDSQNYWVMLYLGDVIGVDAPVKESKGILFIIKPS